MVTDSASSGGARHQSSGQASQLAAGQLPEAAAVVFRLIADDGSAGHPHILRLADAGASSANLANGASSSIIPNRDIADALHALCALHGRTPGIIDIAAQRAPDAVSLRWLQSASEIFAGERALLARLVAAAGPIPSTPGHAESEAAIAAQRHAIETLARSDRTGCPLGAATALMLDWQAARNVMAVAAARLGIDLPGLSNRVLAEAGATLGDAASSPGIARAISFGAQQLLAQHRGLWSLLEARAAARSRS